MNSPSVAGREEPSSSGLVTVGPGWAGSAVVAALMVSLIYLPSHNANANASAVDGLIAAVAALYVIGLSVSLVRLVRGALLRLAGSPEPIVVLGRGPETIVDARIPASWRLAAVLTGTLVAALGTVGSAWLGLQANAATYAHALATLGLGVNFAVAASILVPAPGFMGWALMLALVDAAGTPFDQRIPRAARVARALGIPAVVALGVAAVALGDPMLVLLAAMLTVVIATRTRLAVGQDAIGHYLEGRVAGDLARPIVSHADAHEAVDAILQRSPAAAVVTAIEVSGALVGAVGPAQLADRDLEHRDQRISQLMVGLAELPLVAASTPAGDVMPMLPRHGFVLVRAEDGLRYIEAIDLLEQIRGAGRPSAASNGPRETARSGALGQRDRGDHDGDGASRDRREGHGSRRATPFNAEPEEDLAHGRVDGEGGDEDRPRQANTSPEDDDEGDNAEREARY